MSGRKQALYVTWRTLQRPSRSAEIALCGVDAVFPTQIYTSKIKQASHEISQDLVIAGDVLWRAASGNVYSCIVISIKLHTPDQDNNATLQPI